MKLEDEGLRIAGQLHALATAIEKERKEARRLQAAVDAAEERIIEAENQMKQYQQFLNDRNKL